MTRLLSVSLLAVVAWLGSELSLGLLVHFSGPQLWKIGFRRPGDGPQRIAPEALQEFIHNRFDPELGWDHPPRPLVRDYGRTLASAYGDSFTECTGPDEETWETHLSDALGANVVNHGVFAYGPDQALLKLERTYPLQPTPIVLFGYFSRGISRIVNVYGHARMVEESGGFLLDGKPFFLPTKPRYRLDEDNLILLPNPVRSGEDVSRLIFEPGFASSFARNDYFRAGYDLDSCCPALRFPYLVSLTRALHERVLDGTPQPRNFTPELMDNTDIFALLTAILDRFHHLAAQRSFRGVVVLFGEESELRHFLRTGAHQHLEPIVRHLETRRISYVDTLEILARHYRARQDGAAPSVYYGTSGHHSAEAHRVIAGGIAEMLRSSELRSSGSAGRPDHPPIADAMSRL